MYPISSLKLTIGAMDVQEGAFGIFQSSEKTRKEIEKDEG